MRLLNMNSMRGIMIVVLLVELCLFNLRLWVDGSVPPWIVFLMFCVGLIGLSLATIRLVSGTPPDDSSLD